MLPLNHKRNTSSLAPPIFNVAKNLAIKDKRKPIALFLVKLGGSSFPARYEVLNCVCPFPRQFLVKIIRITSVRKSIFSSWINSYFFFYQNQIFIKKRNLQEKNWIDKFILLFSKHENPLKVLFLSQPSSHKKNAFNWSCFHKGFTEIRIEGFSRLKHKSCFLKALAKAKW
jgi:hypothetical protein